MGQCKFKRRCLLDESLPVDEWEEVCFDEVHSATLFGLVNGERLQHLSVIAELCHDTASFLRHQGA